MTLSTQQQTKTYFHTQDKEFDLPLEFVTSKNDKYIVVQYVSAVYKDFLVGDLCFHSDIVQRNAYCDSFVMMANKQQTKYRKYTHTHSATTSFVLRTRSLRANK